MCRIEVPASPTAPDAPPLAEIEYPIGDKSRSGENTTETQDDGRGTPYPRPSSAAIRDTRLSPRLPEPDGAGNPTGWRRWHHANMELLAEQVMNLLAKGDVMIQSDTKITLEGPAEHPGATPEASITGNNTVEGAWR